LTLVHQVRNEIDFDAAPKRVEGFARQPAYLRLKHLEALGIQETPRNPPNSVVFWRVAVCLSRLATQATPENGQLLRHQGRDRSQCDVGRETGRILQQYLPASSPPVIDLRAEEHRFFGTGAS
jgi:hypothetical protein